MEATAVLPRQIWALPSQTRTMPHCTAFNLPAHGVLLLDSTASTLTSNAVYQPPCTALATIIANDTLPLVEYRVSFVSSTIPQIFVLGAMLTFSWILWIMLVITPRTSFIIGGGGILGRYGGGSSSVIGIGGRPWLQHVAAFTVVISLCLATGSSLKCVSEQYAQGYEDVNELTSKVVGSLELLIVRIISDTFLWLAQVQTLIRLFPRHREKVLIKWFGFALITLDTIFAIVNTWADPSPANSARRRPHRFTEAIPALAYLFQLSLSLIYAASVFYYSIVKRRFAYYHPKMPSIFVVSILSLAAISIPVVFFVLDIAKPNLIGWGDYVRWVGAAAASVVVWEWVERIEALEREERKDGILGREIFDGDEMLDSNTSMGGWPRSRRSPRGTGDGGEGGDSSNGQSLRKRFNFAERFPKINPKAFHRRNNDEAHAREPSSEQNFIPNSIDASPAAQTLSPIAVASPISRSDTTSAASTVYAVVHNQAYQNTTPRPNPGLPPITSDVPLQTFPDRQGQARGEQESAMPGNPDLQSPRNNQPTTTTQSGHPEPAAAGPAPATGPASPTSPTSPISPTSPTPSQPQPQSLSLLTRLGQKAAAAATPLSLPKRAPKKASPPAEVSLSALDSDGRPSTARVIRERSFRDLFKLRAQDHLPESELPVVIVPARTDGAAWSPEEHHRGGGSSGSSSGKSRDGDTDADARSSGGSRGSGPRSPTAVGPGAEVRPRSAGEGAASSSSPSGQRPPRLSRAGSALPVLAEQDGSGSEGEGSERRREKQAVAFNRSFV